jgi:hypothetical protein
VHWGQVVSEIPTATIEAPEDIAPVASGRTATVTWSATADAPDILHLDVHFEPGGGDPKLVLPWDGELFGLTAALVDDEILTVDADDIAADPIGLALPIGLARLSDGLWLVERTSETHLAASFSKSGREVYFEDHTVPEDQAADWRFLVIRGSPARALDVARSINAVPGVALDCPDVENEGGKCGCATRSPVGLWPLLALLTARRRARATGTVERRS